MLVVTNEYSHMGMIKIPITFGPQAAQSLGYVLWGLRVRFQAEACGYLDKALEMILAMLIQMGLIETFGLRAKANQILWDVSIIVIGSLERKGSHAIISFYVPFASLSS